MKLNSGLAGSGAGAGAGAGAGSGAEAGSPGGGGNGERGIGWDGARAMAGGSGEPEVRRLMVEYGEFFWQDPGVTRAVKNIGMTPINIVEFELK